MSIRSLICLAALAVAGVAQAGEGYPRVAAHTIGNPHNYESPALQAQLAKFDLAILNYWPGWEGGRGTTMDAVVRNIKSKNPQSKVFLYVIAGGLSRKEAAWSELVTALDANKWWLYPSGSSGNPVADSWPGYLTANTTLYAPKDANGDRWIDFFAKWLGRQYYQKNPSIDGFYTDTVYWKPRDKGDWNLDGKIDSTSDPVVTSWMREGYAGYFSVLRKQMPADKLQLGNISDWGPSDANLSHLTGTLDGGLIEGLIGFEWSPERWGGWSEMMRWYRKALNATKGPRMAVFHQVGPVNDYQAMRYGLASALMDDGYYSFNAGHATGGDSGYGDAPWFDEYDADLGKPLGGPSTKAWKQGVYRRDYQNGIVIVNPKGNGTQVLSLDDSYKKLKGNQAPTVNDGKTVTSVTLSDRDGIILKRINPRKPIAAPRATLQ